MQRNTCAALWQLDKTAVRQEKGDGGGGGGNALGFTQCASNEQMLISKIGEEGDWRKELEEKQVG